MVFLLNSVWLWAVETSRMACVASGKGDSVQKSENCQSITESDASCAHNAPHSMQIVGDADEQLL